MLWSSQRKREDNLEMGREAKGKRKGKGKGEREAFVRWEDVWSTGVGVEFRSRLVRDPWYQIGGEGSAHCAAAISRRD